MKKRRFFCLPALLLCFFAVSMAEGGLTLFPAEPIQAGAEKILFTVEPQAPEGLRMNVFSGEEAIAASVAVTGPSSAEVTLTRPLREGETLRVFADVLLDGTPSGGTEAVFPVEALFGGKLSRLRARADAMWPVWRDEWGKAFLEGRVWLRANFRDLPFVTFPDEAPEIAVEEAGGDAGIRFSEPVPEDWSVLTAVGMPVTLTPCVREADGAYTAKAGFDSVYLVSDQGAERVSVTVVYQRTDGFLASWPIVEWIQPDTEEPIAFNCYGNGTARGFSGGMYAVVGNGAAWYAEYDSRAGLVTYTDLMTGYAWDKDQTSVGEPVPEGYVLPVEIW